MASPLRVLHLPHNVGGHPSGLARAERELGVDSRAISFHAMNAATPADEVLLADGAGRARRELRRWGLLVRALREADVVHFNFGESILPRSYPARSPARRLYALYARGVEFRDLGWLRRAGKAVFVTYQGDDARQTDVARRLYPITHVMETGVDPAAFDAGKRRAIARFAQHAHRVYALNPDLLHVLPQQAEFLPYANVDPRSWQPHERGENRVPVVVHAPTDRAVKGTRNLLEAVDRLRADGVEVELDLVEGVPNAQARERYARADLAVDQLLAGWYGGFAVELMALGTPVVSYVREQDLDRIPPAMRDELPILQATAETIEAVLREWLTERRGELRGLGQRGRAYVERWHDPLEIARRTIGDYEAALAQPRR
jgi:glycosyltransferase involved in cell wall biosynthesis